MSEYQYYEFVAIDRPLTEAEKVELRKLSSRAEITATRFSNEYNYGSFRGDENVMMTKYFDAMVYVANWGTHRFMVRLPADALDAAPYLAKDALTMRRAGNSIVLDFRSETEDSGWEEGDDYLGSVVGVRDELVRGDLRALYLGWLCAAGSGHVKDDAREPPVPPGLRTLPLPLKSLAEYLRIDPDLLDVAADRSDDLDEATEGLERFIAELPKDEKTALLVEVVSGNAVHVGAKLTRRFRTSISASASPEVTSPMRARTVRELLDAAESRADARERKEAERALAKRVQQLDALAKREGAVWKDVDRIVGLKVPRAYKEAIALLKDLRDLAVHKGQAGAFEVRVAHLRKVHSSKSSFIRQLAELAVIREASVRPSFADA